MTAYMPPLLQGLLPIAVEGWHRRWAGSDHDRRAKRWGELGTATATAKGERLTYDGFSEALPHRTRPGESAAEFNRLAEALALGAFQPGGIRFAGLRFQADDDRLRVTNEETT